jgi:hypothetical protein
MREQKCLMERQVELLERTKRMLIRRRTGFEKKMERLREERKAVWKQANAVIAELLKSRQ